MIASQLRPAFRPLVLLSLLSAIAIAQGPPPAASALPRPAADSYAAEPFVVLSRHAVVTMHADGTGVREQAVAIRIQSDTALRQLGVLVIPFAASAEHVDFLYVRVRHPDGTVLPTATADALDEPLPVTREAPFYSDLKQKELPIRSLRIGDTLEWQVRVVRTASEAPNQFWDAETFAKDAVILSEDLELHTPASLPVTIWTRPGVPAPTTTTTTADPAHPERVTLWHHVQLTATVGPAAEATKKAKETHLLTPAEELDATEGALPDLAWTTFPSWAAVGAWYRGMEGDRAVPDATIRAKAAELTAGKTTPEDKARALYSYVSTQIRYIGVAFGIGRYQPHTAAEVLANQYGDCKDKHTLLSSLLAAVGIPSDAVLVGADIRFNPDVPSPTAFNHLITRAHLDGQDIFLDTTAEVAPWRVLFPILRDHTALIVPDTGVATVGKTPAGSPFPPYATFQVTGTLADDLTSDSQIEATYHDDDELGLRTVLHQVSAAQYTEFGQRLMAGMGFGGTVSDVQIRHADDTSQPLVLAFHYHRVKSPDWGENRITATFLFIPAPAIDDQHPPVSTILLGQPRTETSSVQVKLPPHWTAELPEAVHAHAPFATCDVTFRLESKATVRLEGPDAVPLSQDAVRKALGNAASVMTLFEERRYTVLQEKVPLADLKAYQAWYTKCGAGSVPFIQLRRAGKHSNESSTGPATGPATGSSTGPATGPSTGSSAASSAKSSAGASLPPSNDEAARLITQANTAIQAGQTDTARDLLNQAKALNPDQRGLWGTYGYRAYMLGITSEAIAGYRKEIALYPDTLWPYAPLAEELAKSGHADEAITTLRAGIEQDPANGRNQLMLATILFNNGDPAASITAATEALKTVAPEAPEFSAIQIALATAQVATGQMAPAAERLSVSLKDAKTPAAKNTLAYLLAETGLHLPEAEAAARSALEDLYTQSRSWTLDESPDTMQQTSTLIAASWDTLGYIFLREDKLAEARSYLEAAWKSRHDLEIGQHLGAIQLAQHDPEAAARTLQLALGALPPARFGGKVSPASAQTADRVRAELAEARKAGAKTTLKDPHTELQQLRIIALGAAHGVSGSAEYRLLIAPAGTGSADRIERARAAGDPLPHADQLLQAVTLTGFLPAGVDARIMLTGYLNCVASSATCQFVLAN